MTDEINQQLPALLLGRPANDEEAERRADRLVKLADRLRLVIRELNSAESLLRLQQAGIPRIAPRDRQYAAEWALKHQMINLRNLKGQALRLAGVVNELLDRNGLRAMQAANEFHTLMDNLGLPPAECTSALHGEQNLQAAIEAQGSTVPPVQAPLGVVDTAVPVLTFAWLLLRWAADKVKQNKAGFTQAS